MVYVPHHKEYLAHIALYSSIKCLRGDNGTEFTSENFKTLLINNQITHEISAPYTAHQNGTTERSWQSLSKWVDIY